MLPGLLVSSAFALTPPEDRNARDGGAFRDGKGAPEVPIQKPAPVGAHGPTENGALDRFLDVRAISRFYLAIENTGGWPVVVGLSDGRSFTLEGHETVGYYASDALNLDPAGVSYAVRLPFVYVVARQVDAWVTLGAGVAQVKGLAALARKGLDEVKKMDEAHPQQGGAFWAAYADEGLDEEQEAKLQTAVENYYLRCATTVNLWNASQAVHAAGAGALDHERFCFPGGRPDGLARIPEEAPDYARKFEEVFYAYPVTVEPGRPLSPNWLVPLLALDVTPAQGAAGVPGEGWMLPAANDLTALTGSVGIERAITPEGRFGSSPTFSRLYLTGRVEFRKLATYAPADGLLVPASQLDGYEGEPLALASTDGVHLGHRSVKLGLREAIYLRPAAWRRSMIVSVEASGTLLEWGDVKFAHRSEADGLYVDYVPGQVVKGVSFGSGLRPAWDSPLSGTSVAVRISSGENPRILFATVFPLLALEARATYDPVGLAATQDLLGADGAPLRVQSRDGMLLGFSLIAGLGGN